MLLVVALIMLLMGAVIFNFSPLTKNRSENAIVQIKTLLIYTKAESANSGKRFQVNLNTNAENIISWEPEPIEKPGEYEKFNLSFFSLDFQDYVDIVREKTDNIQIYPDGSMDPDFFITVSKENTNEQYRFVIDMIGGVKYLPVFHVDLQDVEADFDLEK